METGMSYSFEGELVHDWWEYEGDDLELDGRRLQDLITQSLPYRQVVELSEYAWERHYGRVRLTIEVLD